MANVRGPRVVGDGNKPVIEKFVPSAGWTEDSNARCLIVDLPEFKKEQVRIQVVKSTGCVMVSGERATNQNKHVRFDQTYKIPSENSNLDKVTARFESEILYVTVPKQVVEKKPDETSPAATTTTTTIVRKINVNGGDADEKIQQKPHDKDEEVKKADEEVKKADEEVKKADEEVKKADEEVKKADEGSHGDHNGRDVQSKKEEKLDGNACIRFPEDSVKKWEDAEGGLRSAMKTLRENRGIIVTALLAFSLGVLLSRRFQPVGR
ncbi:hypothetical protein FNV43_RR20538 [Rhamnella rubrinervis]|uniref:SHSP domain-containing protein n=1 Tax=Rhamnella rubrinervis TaxID=2594499 RepID=A0A8K0E6P4_9ROSA|nr:hypothetical protein FNV43_RR20538 [Rhamnella rubrinervis]